MLPYLYISPLMHDCFCIEDVEIGTVLDDIQISLEFFGSHLKVELVPYQDFLKIFL